MRVYADASVVLRKLLRQPNPLVEWPHVTVFTSSVLLEVECLRTLDRARLSHGMRIEELSQAGQVLVSMLRRMDRVSLSKRIFRRASEPFPVPLGSLDALHLATALLTRDAEGDFAFATHDEALGLAAGSYGFRVLGLPYSGVAESFGAYGEQSPPSRANRPATKVRRVTRAP